MKHTASASVSTPGWVQVKLGSATTIGYWAWDLKHCYRHVGEAGCRLSFSDGSWLPANCTVDDILVATGAAMQIYVATEKQKTREDGLPSVFDSEQRISTNQAQLPAPSSFNPGF